MKTKTKVNLFRTAGVLFILTGLISIFLSWVVAIIFIGIGIYHITTTSARVEKNDAQRKDREEKMKAKADKKNTTSVYLNSPKPSQQSYVSFDIKQVESFTIQLIESLELVDNSSNPDTVDSRLKFVNELTNKLVAFPKGNRYNLGAEKGLKRYKEMYPNRPIDNHHLDILYHPEIWANTSEINYRRSLSECFNRYLEKQEEQISSLKQNNAKINRFYKIEETLKTLDFDKSDVENKINQMKNKYLL